MKKFFNKVIELLNNLDFYFLFIVFILFILIGISDLSFEITIFIYLLIFLNLISYVNFKEYKNELDNLRSSLLYFYINNSDNLEEILDIIDEGVEKNAR